MKKEYTGPINLSMIQGDIEVKLITSYPKTGISLEVIKTQEVVETHSTHNYEEARKLWEELCAKHIVPVTAKQKDTDEFRDTSGFVGCSGGKCSIETPAKAEEEKQIPEEGIEQYDD